MQLLLTKFNIEINITIVRIKIKFIIKFNTYIRNYYCYSPMLIHFLM